MEHQKDILQEESRTLLNRRRSLLPWWIKVFIWIFLVFGAFVPFALIFGVLGKNFQISLYGFETNDPFSITGLFLIILFLMKGIAAYGLWTEKNWAIHLGILDAITGLVVCVFAMIYPLVGTQPNHAINFRLEILLLIPYLVLLFKIKEAWQNN